MANLPEEPVHSFNRILSVILSISSYNSWFLIIKHDEILSCCCSSTPDIGLGLCPCCFCYKNACHGIFVRSCKVRQVVVLLPSDKSIGTQQQLLQWNGTDKEEI